MTLPDNSKSADVSAVILAGGRGRRLGGVDKGLVEVAGQRLVERIAERLKPQVQAVLINANRHPHEYRKFAERVVADVVDEPCGPLGGMLTGLQTAPTELVLFCPCDASHIPDNLVEKLLGAMSRESADIAAVGDEFGLQPVCCLMKRELAEDLAHFIRSGARETAEWLKRHKLAIEDFSDWPAEYWSMNTPEDQARLEKLLKRARSA